MFLCKNSNISILFVHVWKGGGTSVESGISKALLAKYGKLWFWRWVKRPFQSSESSLLGNEPVCHLPACDILPLLKKRGYDDLFRIGVVRCPWARLVSMYQFTVKDRIAFDKRFGARGVNRPLGPQEKRGLDIAYRYYTECPYLGFQRWLKNSQHMAMGSIVTWPIAMVPQSYWYFGSDGDQLVQHIYRLDHLEDLRSDLVGRFDLQINIPQKNVGSYDRDLSSYYDEEALAFVEKYHGDDIQRYGFERPF